MYIVNVVTLNPAALNDTLLHHVFFVALCARLSAMQKHVDLGCSKKNIIHHTPKNTHTISSLLRVQGKRKKYVSPLNIYTYTCM